MRRLFCVLMVACLLLPGCSVNGHKLDWLGFASSVFADSCDDECCCKKCCKNDDDGITIRIGSSDD